MKKDNTLIELAGVIVWTGVFLALIAMSLNEYAKNKEPKAPQGYSILADPIQEY